MAKTAQNEAVKTEIVETSAAAQTVAETPTVTVETVTIPEPEVPATPEAEVVAETPKLADLPLIGTTTITPNGMVTENKIVATPKESRLYRLLGVPKVYPKGHQRLVVLQVLLDFRKEGINEVTAKQMVPRAEAYRLTSTTGVETSIAWHLHQMTLLNPPWVECLNAKTTTTVQRAVTPAEATAISPDEFNKLKAELEALKASLTTTK